MLEIHYQVWGAFRDPEEDIDLAKYAAEAGFDGIWIGDHFHPWLNSRPYTHHVWPWLGAVMREVDDLPVGTSVTCPLFRYEPPVLAQAVATLDNMYPGRFELGLGVGEALNEAPFIRGDWPEWRTRAEKLLEAIEVMRMLWERDEYVSFSGEHYQYDDIRLFTRPRDEINVHWAAWGPQSSQLAGEHVDHVITAAGPDLVADRILPNVRAGRERAGRDEGFHVSNEFAVNIGEPDRLVQRARDRGELVPADTELDTPDPRSIQKEANRRLAGMSDVEVQDALNITNDPDDIVEELERLETAGVTRALVGTNCGDPYETIDAFRDHVIPHF